MSDRPSDDPDLQKEALHKMREWYRKYTECDPSILVSKRAIIKEDSSNE